MLKKHQNHLSQLYRDCNRRRYSSSLIVDAYVSKRIFSKSDNRVMLKKHHGESEGYLVYQKE